MTRKAGKRKIHISLWRDYSIISTMETESMRFIYDPNNNKIVITKNGEIDVYDLVDDKFVRIQTIVTDHPEPAIGIYRNGFILYSVDGYRRIYQFYNGKYLRTHSEEAKFLNLASIYSVMGNGDIVYEEQERYVISSLEDADDSTEFIFTEFTELTDNSFTDNGLEKDIIIYTKIDGKYKESQGIPYSDTRIRQIAPDMFVISNNINTQIKTDLWIRDGYEYKRIRLSKDIGNPHYEYIYYLHPSKEEIDRNVKFLIPLMPVSKSLVSIVAKFL
jgi:hypothetical protein